MKLTVLGCWGPYPRAGGACSGYLVRSGDTAILLDCGNGVFGRLREHMDFWQLTAVIITHWHPDHWADLHCIRHAIAGAIREGRRPGPLPVYAPVEPAQLFEQFAAYQEALQLIAIPAAGGQARAGQLELKFFPVSHSLPAYAVRLEAEGKSLVYTGDAAYSEELAEFSRECGLLLAEASLQVEHESKGQELGHLSSRQAGQLARQAGAGFLLLTHLWPEFNAALSLKEAREVFSGRLDLAREGRSWTVEGR
ncbi:MULTISPECIES: MBL fold metallo-hydrolase [unclassified Carboxydocella]|uniref:MBL fold metallo-hydrolase n=1 Tax=unclassified Carboxydocella TaxID=2685367 RepID=UPI0009AC2D78|nr:MULTISPECIES: MBL fold metallo-hydrolase [unclassified Carboxydocella]GAW28644.1 MBL fold metallo-hydrolase [Carboxydocella sp. ULO1]GAW31734.1 MBL fold metallo-hydrolase [Carboxydocella sp. JDF658]